MARDSNKKIVVNNSKPSNKPVVNNKPKANNTNWSFSFKYFNQIENFGIGNKGASWFASLLERLRDLSNYDIDYLSSNPQLRDTLRYHPINWNQTNIPVQRGNFNWLPKDILENNEEFPFLQFQISKATGRVVGFWFENIFHIILLDPMHNIQPSKDYNYFVNPTKTSDSEYNNLLSDIDNLKKFNCDTDCKLHAELCNIPTISSKNFYSFSLDDDSYAILGEKIKDKSITDLIELGLLSID